MSRSQMELTWEDLLIVQQDLGRKIHRVVENLKKSISQAKMTGGDVQSRMSSIEDYWSQFQQNHAVLTFKHGDKVKETDYVKKEYADWVEERYLEQKGRLLDLAQQYGGKGSSSSKKVPEASSPAEASSGTAPLPRMQLPEFHGEYVEWPAFKDLFLSIVESNKNLSKVDRLHYLKVSLHGQAADLVKDLPTTNDNYERAWNILKEQYENKRILVRSCLDRLATLKKMRDSSAQEIATIQKTITSVANTLEGMDRPIDKTEDWFVYSMVNLFDPTTRDKWEERITGSSDPASFATLKDFLTKRRQQLEASPESAPTKSGPRSTHCTNQAQLKHRESSRTVKTNHAQQNQKQECVMCKRDHFLMQCPEYKALSPAERRGRVEKAHLCYNCLGKHLLSACPSTRSCMSCGERHHSSIHDAFRDGSRQTTSHHTLDCRGLKGKVLLATALIHVADHYGRQQEVRALIDQGSEVSMITEGLAQRLQLTRTASSVDIFGVGGQQLARARGRVNVDITASTSPSETIKVSAIVLKRITGYTHGSMASHKNWSHLKGLKMADPNPNQSRPIEVLLGADVYPVIIKEGLRKGSSAEPIGQLTVFGWIITGSTGTSATTMHAQVHQVIVNDSLNSLVRRFWEQEELQERHMSHTTEELECEHHFTTTHTRTTDGRYQVRLPFRRSGPITSGSRTASWHALRRMEQRCDREEKFKTLYSSFMREYIELGHMSLANEPSINQTAHYLPHHGVLKPSSTTTKLRVVFNGSWTGAGQQSLNDCLHVGPNLLPLLSDVLLRWRTHQYVVTADVTKMYRQILVHPEDRDFQRILWRNEETQQVSDYRLNTVTYGLSCAPYLAVRTLRQLAEDEGNQFPIGARALQNDTYVDDILTGADSIPALKEAANQLLRLCMAGGFPLQKWASNAAELHDFTQQSQESAAQSTQQADAQGPSKTWTDTMHSALGLQWSPSDDTFRFLFRDEDPQPLTKRGLVSKAAKLFDPLGWLTPVTVRSKISIQTTWLLGLDWDDPLPPTLATEWLNFVTELKQLEQVRVSRPLFQSSRPELTEIHGFADASEQAYGAVVYLRTKSANQQWALTLVTAKSKVAPLQQVSLPRLELCAAHLLARLTQHVTSTLNMTKTDIHLWSDSTVALGWIQGHPSKWKTYVANRVADIQRRLPDAHWHHVNGTENPADCASRGISPSQLLVWPMWWEGPEFLKRDVSFTASRTVNQEQLPEQRGPVVAVITDAGKEEVNVILERFSSYTKLLRVTAWCLRWSRKRQSSPSSSFNVASNSSSKPPVLTPAEITTAERVWIRQIQGSTYSEEVTRLSQNKAIPSRSSLAALAPYLDDQNLLRIGGRLGKAILNPDEAHPVILPPRSRFTQLLVAFTHKITMHGGVQSTLGAIRQRFWIPKGRATVKRTIHKCVTCLRWRAEPARQMMGELPAHRVTPARPFNSTGVDYAGPIWLRTTAGRGHKAYKGFFVVFVCMVTKAIHLEVASDYTAEAFLAAFRRFVSRRDICAHLYSDCGTNFKGADSELRRLFDAKSRESHRIREEMSNLRTEWHFNPPSAPHFGGLWEAAVKSTKHHLRRVIGEARLTFEEMTTLLTQVEACLNSRPLTALSDDPSDLTALTPGHFLVGSALQEIPEPSLLDEATNRLTRWQHITKMRDQFWMSWKREYLQGLTSRSKWRKDEDDVTRGSLCIIIDEQTPPARWPLARFKEIHPGSDGKVRVVTVVTSTSEYVRPIHKLVILPIDSNDR